MKGACGPCGAAAVEIQRGVIPEMWAAAIARISDPHVRECVREYLQSIRDREAVIRQLSERATGTGASRSAPA